MNHTAIILSYLHAGLSIIPIRRDGSKAPLGEWAIYQTRQATEDEVARWIAQGITGWGLVCGAVSGNVEVLDFDAPEMFHPWRDQIPAELFARLVIQQTPSGGWHVIYRAPQVEGNQKLARRLNEDSGELVTMIETRGEGGQILVEPTTADYHPERKPYTIRQGALTAIQTISADERADMLNAARLLNEYYPAAPSFTPQETPSNGNGHGLRPGDDFAESTTWQEILGPAGWRPLRQHGDRIIWQRPGKDGPGGSAITGGSSKRNGWSGLYVYSTNAAPFDSDHGYGKFHAYALLKHGGDFTAAARELAEEGYGGQVIIRPPRPKTEETTEPIPDTIEELLGADVPALPEAARIDPALGANVCKWLDEYAALSQAWSPRAYADFHTACALWMLSTVAARRVTVHMGGPRYPNLYIALVARTSLWAKSTTAKIVNQTLREAGLSFLLAPDDSTPQRFISDLVQKVPADWDQMDTVTQRAAKARLAFSGARGWFYEEMGMKLDAMLAPAGFMADFRGILRAFDDCPVEYSYASIGRGLDAVKLPYIAMLGNLTPADIQRATAKSASLWQDGFWARWAFVTPPGDCNSSRARFPEGERQIPLSIVEPIRQWHERLGVPGIDIEPRRGADGKPSGYEVFADPLKRTTVLVDKDAAEAFYAYHDGLLDLLENMQTRDFDGNYARFAEKALRVAMLIASLENDDQITLNVWARAQSITERWRRSLHELYAQANEPPPNEQQQREDKALDILKRIGEATAADVARYAHCSSMEMGMTLDALAHGGAVVKVAETRRGTIKYAVA